MASKDEGLTTVLLDEVERNLEQMADLSAAFARAATHTWTRGLRATADAFDAATGDTTSGGKKQQDTRDAVERVGRGLRDFTRRAAIGYSDALRDGASRYVEAVDEVRSKRAAKAPARASQKRAPQRKGRKTKA